MSALIVVDEATDTWTCDHWTYNGVWTTKGYALTAISTGALRWCRARFADRARRCCATVNALSSAYCKRCGHPRPTS